MQGRIDTGDRSKWIYLLMLQQDRRPSNESGSEEGRRCSCADFKGVAAKD
jgi:hypothetical protein